MLTAINILDTHTGGEPTRVVLDGGPDLGTGSLSERLKALRLDFDRYRSAVVNEPRGSDVMVGALLTEPVNRDCAAGVIFFNNAGYLGMCGHGMMGVVVALGHLGRITAGTHRMETPAGIVSVQYDGGHRVVIENVPSYRHDDDVALEIPDFGKVYGEIAWGGNWFFLTSLSEILRFGQRPLPPMKTEHAGDWTAIATTIRNALREGRVTGKDNAEIDHIEICGPALNAVNSGRNFVLCPGGAYDRSPCGTGTSAKLACLAQSGRLQPGELWRQESVLGSVFEASYRWHDNGTAILPTISGTAHVNGEARLLIDPADPFAWGIRPAR